MSDLISREAAKFQACNWSVKPNAVIYDGIKEAIKSQLDMAPAVDAAPVVHGRWITNKYGETVCSECDNNALQVLTGCLVNRHFEPHKSEFCPNCGAKMDKEG